MTVKLLKAGADLELRILDCRAALGMTDSRRKKLKGQSIPHVGTPGQRPGLNTTTGGASGWRVECRIENGDGYGFLYGNDIVSS